MDIMKAFTAGAEWTTYFMVCVMAQYRVFVDRCLVQTEYLHQGIQNILPSDLSTESSVMAFMHTDPV